MWYSVNTRMFPQARETENFPTKFATQISQLTSELQKLKVFLFVQLTLYCMYLLPFCTESEKES
jgi:hypothetical protein